MDNIILSPIPLDQLIARITESVVNTLQATPKEDNQIKLLSVKECCSLLKVTVPTLNSYVAAGKLSKYKVGAKIFYKLEEVEAAIKTVKRYQGLEKK